jgi:hypothetical protein
MTTMPPPGFNANNLDRAVSRDKNFIVHVNRPLTLTPETIKKLKAFAEYALAPTLK